MQRKKKKKRKPRKRPPNVMCRVCGFVYEPYAQRADLTGINRGTAFEKLQPGWKCPVCETEKEEFKDEEEVQSKKGK